MSHELKSQSDLWVGFSFVIWYDDGAVRKGSTEEDWESFPKHGVLFVKEPNRKPNSLVHMGMDYYWLEGGQVLSCNRMDVDRYLERPQGMRCVKFGRWGLDSLWKKFHDEAMKVS